MPYYSHGETGAATAPPVYLLDDNVDEPWADPSGSLIVVVLLVDDVDEVVDHPCSVADPSGSLRCGSTPCR